MPTDQDHNVDGYIPAMEQFNPVYEMPAAQQGNAAEGGGGGMPEFALLLTAAQESSQRLDQFNAAGQKGFEAYRSISTEAAQLYVKHDAVGAAAVTAAVDRESPVLSGGGS